MTRGEIKNTPELVDFVLDRSLGEKSREELRVRLHEICNLALKALEQEPKSEWEHDHEILKAHSDGANETLDKIRAEIEQAEIGDYIRDAECFRAGLNRALNIIDKYKAEGNKKE